MAANIFFSFLLAGICTLTGRVSKAALDKQTFAFSVPAATSTNAVASDRVLGIRSLQIAAPFEGRSLVYRTEEFSYARDPYAEFLDSPEEDLMGPVCQLLRNEGGFLTVLDPGSALKPGTLVEISVSQLFGDFRHPEYPAAILTMRFIFFGATNGVPGKAIFQQEYSRSLPLGEPSAAALMAGWERALSEILAQVSSDFRNLETSALTSGDR